MKKKKEERLDKVVSVRLTSKQKEEFDKIMADQRCSSFSALIRAILRAV